MSIDQKNIDGVILTEQQIIHVLSGNIFHCMKNGEPGYSGFGEAYFSWVEPKSIKAWKRHRKMTLNIVVPLGAIRFVLYDERHNSGTEGQFQEIVLQQENYFRLTVPPMVWFGFQGVCKNASMLLNIANIPHDPNEVDKKCINRIDFLWV